MNCVCKIIINSLHDTLCFIVYFPDGVGHRHKTVAKIVVFGSFYSKNKGKLTNTVTRKIES